MTTTGALLALQVAVTFTCVLGQLRVITEDGKISLLNATTGELSNTSPVVFPPGTEGCEWKFGDGTRGQASTVFYMNGTWFITAQEVCGQANSTVASAGEIAVLGIWGPYPEGTDLDLAYQMELAMFADAKPPQVGDARVYNLDNVTKYYTSTTLDDFAISWDWACNVVVNGPKTVDSNTLTYPTLQLSEYDSAIRPKADYTTYDPSCGDCWQRVPGPSGVDYADDAGWAPEWSCGDACALVTKEQHMVDGKVVAPGRLIGRSFRTGKDLYEISETIPVSAFTYNIVSKTFIGLGTCCADSWCARECIAKNGAVVLVEFAKGSEPRVLYTFTDITSPANTFRIGVELTNLRWAPTQTIFVTNEHNQVITLEIVSKTGEPTVVKPVSVSPPISSPIKLWAGTRFY